MLRAIFYARFHPERGPSVIHQYPHNSIRPSPSPTTTTTPTAASAPAPLLLWSDISSYIVPPYDVCNQSLSICTHGNRVLAFPISLENDRYDRNRFTFNVCFVLGEEVGDRRSWEQMVRKTARFFRILEEEDGVLRREEELVGLKWAGEAGYPVRDVGVVYALLEGIVEDLNAYGECSVRVDEVHVLNLRLEVEVEEEEEEEEEEKVVRKVRAWDVPLLIRDLPPAAEWTWDLTLKWIYPHVDGIRHVQRIAELADVELKLAKRAVRELVYHGRAMLLDIFHFQAIYACTPDIAVFMRDEALQDECRRYVAVISQAQAKETTADATPVISQDASLSLPSREEVTELFCLLQPGLQLGEFCMTHQARLLHVDIRRLITFGTIKGFLRRLHKYALALDAHFSAAAMLEKKRSGAGAGSSSLKPRSGDDAAREYDRAWRRAALSSGWATPPSGPHPASFGKSHKSADQVRTEEDEQLRDFLDGEHCMDEICVAMHLSERKVLERLRSGRFGKVILFNK
ncbi:Nitrogen permease regulator 2 [Lecanosticta acicola]|uniref:Nitrogen permease regulator 2 n=1 Tax=Lecanosticta acicola TaxID=111012 RepID=A0AAI8W183_9PEZI|nr:Nitrogen permease regulator 2 [Lecanosticta acicola]